MWFLRALFHMSFMVEEQSRSLCLWVAEQGASPARPWKRVPTIANYANKCKSNMSSTIGANKNISYHAQSSQGIENSSILAWKKLTHPWARSPTLRNCQPANVELSIYSASDSSHLNILHAHILRQLTNFNRSCQQVTITVQIALYRSR